jgi:fatty acid-binding protein DegV
MAIEDEKKLNPEIREVAEKKRLAEKIFIYEMDSDNFESELKNQDDQIVLVHVSSQKSGNHQTWEII